MASPVPPSRRARLSGARLTGGAPLPTPEIMHVDRVVSAAGTLMVAGCKLQVSQTHRGKIVTIGIHDAHFRITHDGQELSVHPRTIIKEVNRRQASGHAAYRT